MLQPLQLEEVSVRCASEIAELCDFFNKAGVALNTSASFSSVATRVRTDRAFSRDLTSHVWVFLNASDKQISYSDLLGMLAIASAGPAFAASASEADAHFLLRFLMDARNAFDTPVAPRTAFVPLVVAPVAAPLVEAPAIVPTAAVAHIANDEREDTPLIFEMPQDEDAHRPLLWFAVAACLLLALFGGFWLFRPSPPNNPGTSATTVSPTPFEAPSAAEASKSMASSSQNQEGITPAKDKRPSHTISTPPVPQPSGFTPRSRPTASRLSGIASPPAVPSGPNGKPSPSTQLTAVARSAPTEASSSPRLLRHSPTPSSSALSSSPNLTPAPVYVAPLAGPGNNSPIGGVVHKATVRATSLGSMAANVTYSPAPAYPSAASALHVQGEVKLEAEVDPTGSVISTRIISGPPLLQAAAADALQRWRYRPYLYNDKPIGMNATVVMDFQLP